MTRRIGMLLVLAGLAAPSLGAPQPAGAAKKADDLTQFQGRWKPESVSSSGDAPPTVPVFIKPIEIEFKGSVWTASGEADTEKSYSEVKLDQRAKPPRPTATAIEPPKPGEEKHTPKPGGKTERYVYKLDGDTLTMTASRDTKRFPDAVEPKPGRNVFVFKRIKDK
jgi:uncharacterized protein (TIGR03067 family)